ncbi:MAG: hypothetical protein AAB695_00755 [Patescibacteria group bacterium]
MSRKIIISENQLALPFRERGTRVLSFEDRRRFFWFLAGICFFALVLYIYAIEATARNIAMRANLETRVAEAEGKLSSLEFAYIELKNNVSIELARLYGFEEIKTPLYVSRDAANSLTLNTVRR